MARDAQNSSVLPDRVTDTNFLFLLIYHRFRRAVHYIINGLNKGRQLNTYIYGYEFR